MIDGDNYISNNLICLVQTYNNNNFSMQQQQ